MRGHTRRLDSDLALDLRIVRLVYFDRGAMIAPEIDDVLPLHPIEIVLY